ncbi:RNA-binding protein [Halocatena pleomorpha]|uniref:RNA-binding protein n=1 Tax=Halocatena pleomorpha TaxID=1785090 RepID=A0A3P3RJD4_9EURY|nr:RNA-binding protein [Halocatena pleomorpha]RRJ33621.1 RNA-binding protein [Halocatena pleomorpha]
MSGVPFHYVDLQAFCYATEDEPRVERALRTFLPEEFEIERVENTGYAGDRIVVLSARVESADAIRHVLAQLDQLSAEEWTQLRDELDRRVTENCELYLYLDKQAALAGEVTLGKGLSFRGKVEAYPAKKESAIENVIDAFDPLSE